jgi:ankyrin repeat protein
MPISIGFDFLTRKRHEGADIEAKDEFGWTAMHEAARSGHEAVVQLLLEKGVGIEAKEKNGRTTLWIATASGQEAVVRLVLEKGADLETEDKDEVEWWKRQPVAGAGGCCSCW